MLERLAISSGGPSGIGSATSTRADLQHVTRFMRSEGTEYPFAAIPEYAHSDGWTMVHIGAFRGTLLSALALATVYRLGAERLCLGGARAGCEPPPFVRPRSRWRWRSMEWSS